MILVSNFSSPESINRHPPVRSIILRKAKSTEFQYPIFFVFLSGLYFSPCPASVTCPREVLIFGGKWIVLPLFLLRIARAMMIIHYLTVTYSTKTNRLYVTLSKSNLHSRLSKLFHACLANWKQENI